MGVATESEASAADGESCPHGSPGDRASLSCSHAEPRASTFGSHAEPRASTFGSHAEPRASTFGSHAEPRASTVRSRPELETGGVGLQQPTDLSAAQSVRVSGAVFCACRAGFVERGQWEALRSLLAARLAIDPEALDRIAASDWLDLASLTALLDAQFEYIDLDVLRTSVRRHVTEAESGHVYASMLRSWTRSFASAEHMLRALGPLFRAGLRNAEVPLVRGLGGAQAHVLVRGPLLAPLCSSLTLRAAFEGLLLGLLDLARPRPMLPEVELSFSSDELCAVCHF